MKCFLIILTWAALPSFLCAQKVADSFQYRRIDSIYQRYKSAKNDTLRLHELTMLVMAYSDIRDFKSIMIYCEQMRLLSDTLRSSKDKNVVLAAKTGEAYMLYHIGLVLEQRNSRQSVDYYFKALKLFESLRNDNMIQVTLSRTANVYSKIGNHGESLKYSFKGLKCLETQNNKGAIAAELNNIGATYDEMNNLAKALYYFTSARDISQTENDKQATALYTSNVGHGYQKLADSAKYVGDIDLSVKLQDKALKYYFQALKGAEESLDKFTIADCLENIGESYSGIGDYKTALSYFVRALPLHKELNMPEEQSYDLMRISEIQYILGRTILAEEFLIEALNTVQKTSSLYYLMDVNRSASKFYESTNRPGAALKHYKHYINYKDSLYSKENAVAFARTEMDYEFEKKAAASKFSHDKVVYQLESDNALHEQWRLFFIIVIILAFILLYFVKRAYDNKKKLAALLEEEDQRKEMLLQEVHHRINNNLQIISSLLTLQANNAENEKLTEYLTQSQNRIQSLSALHELLYDTNSPLEINMKDYVDKVLDFHKDVANSSPNNISITADIKAIKFPTKLAVPLALIINELVTNALKYAFRDLQKGIISIELTLDSQSKWNLVIADNGNGMPQEVNRRKDSLGLKLVRIMTKQIGGTLISKNDGGAVFSVIFSLAKV